VSVFVQRPISAAFIAASAILLLAVMVSAWRNRRDRQATAHGPDHDPEQTARASVSSESGGV